MQFVDCHSHVVPSEDDGAQTVADGVELCRDAARHGTAVLFATPHVWPQLPLTAEREQAIEAAFAAVRAQAPLELRLGYELTPTRRLLHEDLRRYVLEGTDAVLIEVPFAGSVDLLLALLDRAEQQGLRVVVAHPERAEAVQQDPSILDALGPLLQVNATSLVGYHGPEIAKLGWELCESGRAALVGSDGHRLARPARLGGAYEAAVERMGERAAALFDGSALSARPAPSRAATQAV